jgi:hypothetical protein
MDPAANDHIVAAFEQVVVTHCETRGLFDEALYYCLNLMLLHVGSRSSRQLQNDDEERAPSSGQPVATL